MSSARRCSAIVLGFALLLPALSAAVATAPAASAAAARTWYVATSGSDSASGTLSRPLRRLRTAVDRAAAGDTIVLRRGSYHENVAVYTPNLTIRAMPGEQVWMEGARVVTGFRDTGSTWTRDNWHYNLDHSPTFTRGAPDGSPPGWQFVNPAYPMAAYPDQVWVGSTRLRQVASPAAVGRGTFAVDTAADKLVIGSDPAGGTVLASTLSKAISVRATGVRLIGFGVRRYAVSVPDHGAVTLERANTSMTRMKVVDNATSGLGVSADDIRITDSTFSRNGLIGIHGAHSYRLKMHGLTVQRNNLERFNQAPMAGGIKIGRSRGVSLRYSVVTQNYGTAVWWDESVYDSKVVNNRITWNTGHGVHVELSERSVVANNLVLKNADKGIQVVDSGAVRIYNNTLVGNHRPINIIQDKRTQENAQSGHDLRRPWPDPTVPWRVDDVTVRNNVVAYPREVANCMLCVEDGSHLRSAAQMGVRSQANVYVRPAGPRWLVVWSSGEGNPATFTTLSAFRSTTNQETRGVLTSSGVVSWRGRPSAMLLRWGRERATSLPSDIAAMIGVRTSIDRIGVCPWRLKW
jgi:parallel beta-helix repeat protein